MTAAEAVAAIMFAAVVAYSVFGGADFGSGVWDLTAGGAERGARLRRLIDRAIGPVWEANHVWLIFVLVMLWGGFPEPFTALVQALAVPFWLAALGIVARGAAFAFRKFAPTLAWAQVAGIVFAGASLLTPFFLGVIAGAIASGRVPAFDAEGVAADDTSVWLNPTSLLGGVLAVATTTFLAGVLLCAEAESDGMAAETAQLRHRSLIGGAITGIVALVGIPVLIADSELLVDGLLGRGWPLMILSAIGGLGAMALLWRWRLRDARVAAGVAVASVVAGWGVGQYPWILTGQTTIEDGAGASATLIGLLITSGIALVVVVPPLFYLLRSEA